MRSYCKPLKHRRTEIITQSERANRRNFRFRVVAIGGTFDILHRGHRRLLKKAFSVGKLVMIGITSDSFARNLHKPHKIDPYETRKRALEQFLAGQDLLKRAKIVELADRFGLTVRSRKIQALVVSKRTTKTALEINERRRANELEQLEIVPIELILADDERPISSTRIRRGRINKEGRIVTDG